MLAHAASAQGISAVENMCGRPHVLNHLSVPAACFTHPEVGSRVCLLLQSVPGKAALHAENSSNLQDTSAIIISRLRPARYLVEPSEVWRFKPAVHQATFMIVIVYETCREIHCHAQ